MKLSNQQVDALAAEISKKRQKQQELLLNLKMTDKDVIASAKKAHANYEMLRRATEKCSDGELTFSMSCNCVSISYYEKDDAKTVLKKFITYYAGKAIEKEVKHPSISNWDIRQEIILASIDAETLADLGKKLGVKL